MNYIREYFSDMWEALKRLPAHIYEAYGWKGIVLIIAFAVWLGYLTSHTH